jgi:MFS family permease
VGEIGMADSQGVFLVYGATVLFVRVVGSRIPDRIGPLPAASIATLASAGGLLVMAGVPQPVGLFAGTFVFALGMSLLFPAIITLALTGVPSHERGSVVGTVSSFFDGAQGAGAALLGGVAYYAGYRGAFVAGAMAAVAGFALLRLGIDPRARQPVDHDAAKAATEVCEPELP